MLGNIQSQCQSQNRNVLQLKLTDLSVLLRMYNVGKSIWIMKPALRSTLYVSVIVFFYNLL